MATASREVASPKCDFPNSYDAGGGDLRLCVFDEPFRQRDHPSRPVVGSVLCRLARSSSHQPIVWTHGAFFERDRRHRGDDDLLDGRRDLVAGNQELATKYVRAMEIPFGANGLGPAQRGRILVHAAAFGVGSHGNLFRIPASV